MALMASACESRRALTSAPIITADASLADRATLCAPLKDQCVIYNFFTHRIYVAIARLFAERFFRERLIVLYRPPGSIASRAIRKFNPEARL